MPHWVHIDDISGGEITDRAALHRLLNVLRLRAGSEFVGFDGGRALKLRIVSASRTSVSVETLETLPPPTDMESKLIIGQSLLKGGRWDVFLEKAAELGAAEIVPVRAANCVARIGAGEAATKLERWRRIAGSAAAQCRGPLVEVSAPEEFAEFIARDFGGAARYVLTIRPDAARLSDMDRAAEAVLLVGPEGDFTPEEYAAAEAAGFAAVSLGPRVLRAETAAIAAAALILL